MTRKRQNRIGQIGAELGATLETLNNVGCCTDKLWPFIPSRVDKLPNNNCLEEANQYKCLDYETIHVDNFNLYLKQNIPIVIGMHIGRKFLKLKGSLQEQLYYPINDIDNRPSHGHAMVIIGFDEKLNNGSWIVANSMGLRWGDKGFGVIPYSCGIDIGEAYAIRSIAGLSVKNI